MIKERTITFTKLLVPEYLPEAVKKDLSEIESVTVYFDAISEMIQYKGYTEVRVVFPFNPFVADMVKVDEKAIHVAMTVSEIEALIEDKKQALEKARQEESDKQMREFERKAQLSMGVANSHKDAAAHKKILGGGFN